MNPPNLATSTPPSQTPIEVDLKTRFPSLKEVSGPPPLFTLNGFGLSMYGKRGYDETTGTYLKNFGITALFIPIFTLGSYRVADAENGGWYFIGKEKVGPVAKFFNSTLALSALGLIGFGAYQNHISSPDYRAESAINAAADFYSDEDYVKAIESYLKAYSLPSKKHKNLAKEGYLKAVREGLESDDPKTQLFVTRSLVSAPFWTEVKPTFSELAQKSAQWATQYAGEHPAIALEFIDLTQKVEKADSKLLGLKFELLQELKNSNHSLSQKHIEELALLYFQNGQHKETVATLKPIQKKIVHKEAARALAMAYSSNGDLYPAIKLFSAHLEATKQSWDIAATLQIVTNKKNQNAAIKSDFLSLIDQGLVSQDPKVVLEATRSLLNAPFWDKVKANYQSLYEDSCKRAKTLASKDPEKAIELIHLAQSLAQTDTLWVESKLQILETIAATQKPLKLEYAEQLSSMYEQYGHAEKVIQLLEPLKAQITNRPSLRILASSYLNVGKYKTSIELLKGYLASRQQEWLDAQSRYQTTYNNLEKRLIKNINDGLAPSHLYTKTNSLSRQEDIDRVWYGYISEVAQKDLTLVQLELTLSTHSDVPVAIMDLGIAYLRQAQVLPEQRNQLLKKSEETLLSLSSYASESSEYQLFLGQVYYWLGKSNEGRKLFDSVIEKHNGNPQVLYSLARTLREIGIDEEAKKLSEQAYEKTTDKTFKHEIASFRSILSASADERISWLEKCNQSLPSTKIDLSTAKARRESAEGNDELAIRLYKRAIHGYSEIPETAVNLNNKSLILFDVYFLTGEQFYYDEGLKILEKAARLLPNDPIMNHNAASYFFNAAAHDFFKGKIEDKVIHDGVSIVNTLRFFYNNEQQRSAICKKLRAHPHYKKACKYFSKAVLLSPQKEELYLEGLGIFGVVRDQEQFFMLTRKLKEAKIDIAANNVGWEKSIDEINFTELKQTYAESNSYYQKKIDSFNTEQAKAIYESIMLTNDLTYWEVMKDFDLKNRVKRLEQHYAKFPSSAMASALSNLQYAYATQQLVAKRPKFDTWLTANKGTLDHSSMIFLWLDSHNDAQQIVAECPALKAALKTDWELNQRFPNSPQLTNWMHAKLFHPTEVKAISTRILSDSFDTQRHKLHYQWASFTPQSKLHEVWLLMVKGDTADAKKLYQQSSQTLRYLPPAYK